jgi:hypothetical protein
MLTSMQLRPVAAPAGSDLYFKQLALTHISENKKLIALNGDYCFGRFVEAFDGGARTLALEEYSLHSFLELAASLKPVCIDARFFEHMLEFSTPLEFSYSELSRILDTVFVDANTLILAMSPPQSAKAAHLATSFEKFIETARAKGATVVAAP